MTKYVDDSSNFGADGPFFGVIRQGLKGLVDGEDYFDLLADDVVFEYVISVPGYPRRVQGRQNVVDLYRGYDQYMKVDSADNLRIYRDPEASVVVWAMDPVSRFLRVTAAPGMAEPEGSATWPRTEPVMFCP